MRVLLADALPRAAVARLEAAGDEVVLRPDLTETDLGSALDGIDALVVRSTRVTGDALDAADGLGLIVRAGAGTNTIDTTRAAELGMYVCNVPGRNAIAVAGVGTSFLSRSQRTSGPLDQYLQNRSQAERLRSLYFRHLGGSRGDRTDLEADLASITYPSERGVIR